MKTRTALRRETSFEVTNVTEDLTAKELMEVAAWLDGTLNFDRENNPTISLNTRLRVETDTQYRTFAIGHNPWWFIKDDETSTIIAMGHEEFTSNYRIPETT